MDKRTCLLSSSVKELWLFYNNCKKTNLSSRRHFCDLKKGSGYFWSREKNSKNLNSKLLFPPRIRVAMVDNHIWKRSRSSAISILEKEGNKKEDLDFLVDEYKAR